MGDEPRRVRIGRPTDADVAPVHDDRIGWLSERSRRRRLSGQGPDGTASASAAQDDGTDGMHPVRAGLSGGTESNTRASLAESSSDSPNPEATERCGAAAFGGPCVLPRGHNRGRVDIPEYHEAAEHPIEDAVVTAAEFITRLNIRQTATPDVREAAAIEQLIHFVGAPPLVMPVSEHEAALAAERERWERVAEELEADLARADKTTTDHRASGHAEFGNLSASYAGGVRNSLARIRSTLKEESPDGPDA